MNGVALAIFLVVYVVLMTPLIAPMSQFFDWPEDTGFLYLATILLSLGGIGLAWVFLAMKRLSSRTQRYIKIGVFTIYPLMLSFTYFIFGLHAFFILCLLLLQVLFLLFITAFPFIFMYGMLKKMRVALIAPSIGFIWLFLFTLLIPGTSDRFIVTPDEPWSFILLFIGYLAFFELATTTLSLSLMLQKMTAQKKGIEFVLHRFAQVLNSYAAHYVVAMIVCLVFTGSIVSLAELFATAYPLTVIGIRLGSVSGILFSVVITVVSVLLFWLFSPMKRSRQQRTSSHEKRATSRE